MYTHNGGGQEKIAPLTRSSHATMPFPQPLPAPQNLRHTHACPVCFGSIGLGIQTCGLLCGFQCRSTVLTVPPGHFKKKKKEAAFLALISTPNFAVY